MNDTTALADPAVSCDMAINVARRVEALAFVLAAALESPRKAEAQGMTPEVLAVIQSEARRVRRRTEDAAEAIRRTT